jgi:serine phosphatase RsbU (regulator of sigma subunit)/Tfp pilus assembly protein PilF
MKIFHWIVVLIFLLPLTSNSSNIDSLKKVLQTTKSDTMRVKLLKIIGEENSIFRIGYWDSISKDCELLSLKGNAEEKLFALKYLSISLNNIGYVADEQGDIKKAIEYYKKGLNIQEKINDKSGVARALLNIGSVYEEYGDIVQALEYYQSSLKIRELINDERGIANCLNNIGIVQLKQKSYSKSLMYFFKALKLYEKINEIGLKSIVLSNIGLVYQNQQNFNSALVYYLKAQKIQEENGDEFNLTHTLNNIGSYYLSLKKYDLALEYFNRNLKLQERLQYKKGKAVTLSNMADALFNTGKISESQKLAEESIKLLQELGFPDKISSTSYLLSKIYAQTGNYKGAFSMFVLYKKMNDSINNIDNRKAAIQKELQYEYDKKVAADSVRIEADKKINEVKFRQEKTQRYTLYGGLFVLLCVAVFIFNRLQITKKQNVIIENQKMEVELKNEEITHQKDLVEEKQKEIIDSINYAKRIQQAVLTGEDIWNKVSKEHFILFKPKDIVSGDFYWAYNTPNNRSVFALADCTGHGVPGGFMSMLGNSFLNEIVVENKIFKADEILNKLRSKVINALEQKGGTQQKDGMDISLCVWNKLDNTLEFAGANNPLWFYRHNELIEYKADKMPIGTYLETELPFSSTIITLQKGDIIFLSTDGYADQFGGPKGKKYKYKPLIDSLIKNSSLSMEEQKNALELAFNNWKHHLEQVDDVSLIGIRVL